MESARLFHARTIVRLGMFESQSSSSTLAGQQVVGVLFSVKEEGVTCSRIATPKEQMDLIISSLLLHVARTSYGHRSTNRTRTVWSIRTKMSSASDSRHKPTAQCFLRSAAHSLPRMSKIRNLLQSPCHARCSCDSQMRVSSPACTCTNRQRILQLLQP